MNLVNRLVNFRIRDVYVPDPQSVLEKLFGEHVLQGRVLDISRSGSNEDQFAVIEVEGLDQPIIVPADRILGCV